MEIDHITINCVIEVLLGNRLGSDIDASIN
jgi:hypothetical protein